MPGSRRWSRFSLASAGCLSFFPRQNDLFTSDSGVHLSRRCRFILTVMILLSASPCALAQRVRFGAPLDDAAANDVASATAKPPSDVSRTAAGPVYSLAAAPTYTYTAAPPVAPVSNSVVTTPQWGVPGWDPYHVAARPAQFSGTITSTSAGYILPQPMPRVPYSRRHPWPAPLSRPVPPCRP